MSLDKVKNKSADFRKRYPVPISVVCEITGIKESKLIHDYSTLVGDNPSSIPLEALPLDVQDRYVSDYLLHDSYIDLDPFALSGFRDEMLTNAFPIFSTPQFRHFHKLLLLVRKADEIRREYAWSGNLTEMIENLARSAGMSGRTLERMRCNFMKATMINRLLDADHLDYQYNDNRPTICIYAVDYVIYRSVFGIKYSDNKILRDFIEMDDFECTKCPYCKDYSGDRTGIMFTCQRKTDVMIKPNTRYVINRITADISEQDAIMVREGVKAWEDKYHFTPSRKRPERFGFLYITDHHLADLFVITHVYKDGKFDAKRVYVTGVIDGATNAPVGYTLRTDTPNAATVAEAFANAVGFTADSPFHGLCKVWYSDYTDKKITPKSLRNALC